MSDNARSTFSISRRVFALLLSIPMALIFSTMFAIQRINVPLFAYGLMLALAMAMVSYAAYRPDKVPSLRDSTPQTYRGYVLRWTLMLFTVFGLIGMAMRVANGRSTHEIVVFELIGLFLVPPFVHRGHRVREELIRRLAAQDGRPPEEV